MTAQQQEQGSRCTLRDVASGNCGQPSDLAISEGACDTLSTLLGSCTATLLLYIQGQPAESRTHADAVA